ncbi:Gfo/Idh/MocA family oxidoreductase [Faecalicatena contorta]|uniref:Gfo/Idh/MocA family oxidoreductase n=1 Tax=Faecalicatena contorta TaxID=39482 RepID=UPI003B5088BA
MDAYNFELQEWINSIKEGRVDGPNAWDGYVGQISARAALKARDEQRVVKIESQTKPNFYN